MNMPGVTSVKASKMQPEKAAPTAQAANDENVEMEDVEPQDDELQSNKPKKKRRVIKTSDKKYECPQPDCGKSYSRAEHLYRHQLNRSSLPLPPHNPGPGVMDEI